MTRTKCHYRDIHSCLGWGEWFWLKLHSQGLRLYLEKNHISIFCVCLGFSAPFCQTMDTCLFYFLLFDPSHWDSWWRIGLWSDRVTQLCLLFSSFFFFWIHSAACLVLFGTNNCWRSVGGNDWDIADGQECQRRCYLLRLLSWQKQEGANHWLTRDKQASFKQLCLMNKFQSEKDESGIKHRRNHVNMWRDW